MKKIITNFKGVENLSSSNRISSIDFFRGIAILSVVIFHFNKALPFGYLGVDMFFVISGFLVGGLLTKEFESNKPIRFFKFFLQRGFKIWPSYFAFIIIGSVIAYYFYHKTNPTELIPIHEFIPYIFFFQNYSSNPFHWSFAHIWSLCVEEHFYILLPILFLIVQNLVPKIYKVKALFTFVVLTILAGIIFKFVAYYFTNTQDTYFGTLNRVDALAWGVLLNLILTYYREQVKSFKYLYIISIVGLIIFGLAIYVQIRVDGITHTTLYDKLGFHSIIPFCFFLIILGVFFIDFSKFTILKIFAYYSYNWYLWHPIFVIFISNKVGKNFWGFILYFALTFLLSILATVLIEEKVLDKRKEFLTKLFPDK